MTQRSDRILAQIATLGPVGTWPAPGTMGSFVAVITGVAITIYGGIGSLVVAIIIATLIGFPAADAHQRITGITDSGSVVIDEVVGQWLVLLAIPYSAGSIADLPADYIICVIAAFALFRLFDIVKIGPVKMAEDLPGAAGVMADDVMAGALAGGIIILATSVIEYI
jgi:phosphatidylglycerophosphatase A